jgi:transcriptional regulator with XRE-family HTH domain
LEVILDEFPHPIVKERESRGLNRRQFAIRVGLSYRQVSDVELGYPKQIPGNWDFALASLGLIPSNARYDYMRWRHEQISLIGQEE